MKLQRFHLTTLVVAAALVALTAWIARHTYWDSIKVPTPLRGEAARYPLYSAEGLARRLGAQVTRESWFAAPATSDVIYLSDWSWDLGGSRRGDLELWVQAGGRLVIDESVYFQNDTFTRWSGIEFTEADLDKAEIKKREEEENESGCIQLRQTRGAAALTGDAVDRTFELCDIYDWNILRTTRPVTWLLRDRDGARAVRLTVGRGSVTVIRAEPFTWRGLFHGQHADLFVALTQLHGGDHIHFLSEARHPSLLALTWRFGAPAVVLFALALLLALWRNGSRFGPTVPPPAPLRRSLAEQIRGTGQFALRHGGGGALHQAMRRALERGATDCIPGFAQMKAGQRTAAMAAAAAVDPAALMRALSPDAAQRPRTLLAAIALLEAARRRILSVKPGRQHGTGY
jgi:hypothetical protein